MHSVELSLSTVNLRAALIISSVTHCSSCTHRQLSLANDLLHTYYERYRSRLGDINGSNLRSLLSLLQALLAFLTSVQRKRREEQQKEDKSSSILNVNEFLVESRIDQFNLFQLLRFVDQSNLIRKLNGFAEMQRKQTVDMTELTKNNALASASPTNPLYPLRNFLESLTNPSSSGRVTLSCSGVEEGGECTCVAVRKVAPD